MGRFTRAIMPVLLAALILSGCGGSLFTSENDTTAAGGESGSNGAMSLSREENDRIVTLIKDYFSSVYSEPVENYAGSSATGTIPAKLKDFISKGTVSLAEGNPEIGIHLPRFVEFNGLTAVDYEIIRFRGNDGQEAPAIDARFSGSRDGSAFYYVKVELIAKCVNNSTLAALYTLNPQNNLWQKKDEQPLDEGLVDYIRVRARYDVEAVKEDGTYKLVGIKEASTQKSLKNRLYTHNNDFMDRLPYVNSEKDEDGVAYVNENDGKAYEEEKAVILSFFNSLKDSLDSERMKLGQVRWREGSEGFVDFLDRVGQPGDGGAKKLNELMDIREDYRSRFDYASLPIQPDMEKLVGEYKSFEVTPHPGYTRKQKKYFVGFEVSVKKTNGMIEGEDHLYRYDYLVTLSTVNELLKVSGISLNECFRVINASNTENTEQ